MISERYDLVVIGGGIHGVGVAQAAAAAGHRVALIEKERLAAGTSSRSSKLIHGGLRYLAQFHLPLVRTSLHEREILLRIAPRLVRRVPFYIPVYPESRYGSFRLHAGLTLYSLLGGLGSDSRFSRVDPEEYGALDGLTTESLRAVFRYTDAQTDDVELTQAVMRSAKQLGAVLLCPALFRAARQDGAGYEIEFEEADGPVRRCFAATVVNAAGPWINRVHALVSPALDPYPADLVQGAHLVLPQEIHRGVYYVEAIADRRPVFVMPWYQNTLIGTTETLFDGDPENVRATDREVEYLLETYRRYFPERTDEPISSFAGLRVLPRAKGGMNARSRETAFPTDRKHNPRWVTIAGGKLTSYRSTAERALAILSGALPVERPIADTETLSLG
ncbi:MAG: FAD-dependent oxidoreductase [Planctomycetes bacterium]|nr:FAD-dependent oxidoreductase [Planctomycetota bacterium]